MYLGESSGASLKVDQSENLHHSIDWNTTDLNYTAVLVLACGGESGGLKI